jgi:hypothetical protein
MSNPSWKFYPLTKRSQAAIAKLSAKTGVPETTMCLRRANNKRMREARQRIVEALKILISERQCITISELSRKSGCGANTVRKHADLWRGFYGTNPRSGLYGFPVAS